MTRAARSAICVWMGLVSIMAAGLAVKEREHSKGTLLPARDQWPAADETGAGSRRNGRIGYDGGTRLMAIARH